MSPQPNLYAEFTDVFKGECTEHHFPEHEVANVAKLVISDPEAGYVVCVAPASGMSVKCAEIRAVPWTYERNNVSVCALLVYLQVKERPPYFIRLVVDDLREIAVPDPQKLSRWIDAMIEFAHVILSNIA